jgi:phosphoribosylformylglycinamidine synthase
MYIEAVFRNPYTAEALEDLIENRNGLILGVGGGFSALLRLGLLPNGKLIPQTEQPEAHLTTGHTGRHVSRLARVIVTTNTSPWLANTQPGDIHTAPVSHEEGRFSVTEKVLKKLAENNQIAFKYADPAENPFSSTEDIEGITSPDGRILGRMCHAERCAPGLYKNVPGNFDATIFKSGVEYFR